MRISLFLLALTLLTGCKGPLAGNENATIEPYVRADELTVPDRAQWVFQRPLKNLSSHEHYIVEAQFTADQGAVTLHSHFNGFRFRDGVEVKFIRDGDKLLLSLSTPRYTPQTRQLPAGFLDGEGRFRARVEVHNTGSSGGARILVWNDNMSLQGEALTERPFVSAQNADFDSKAQGLIFMSRGHGVKWGLEFENAKLLLANRQAPYAD